MQLRDYQIEIIKEIERQFLKHKRICVQSPCGSGKSVIIGKIIENATEDNNRVLFLVHRKELIEQIKGTLKLFNINMDLVDLMMVQTATKRLLKIKAPKLIITDENHHCLANSYINIYNYFKDSYLLGFTATPVRLNGEGLGNIYDYLILGKEIKWLIDNRFLAPYKLFSVKIADTNNLHVRAGEYKKDEVNKLMEGKEIYGDTIKNYIKLANNKKTIVYCSSITSSKETAKAFNENNIPAIHLDAKTPNKDREQAVQDFRDGKILILCNVDLFGEGFDVPDCECVILLRPTKSLSLYIQQSMRSMRYKPDKEAIIIDHVFNCGQHGLPDDEYLWSLEGKVKGKNKIKISVCSTCYGVIQPGLIICPYCGAKLQKTVQQNKKTILGDIELQEITRKDILIHKPFNHIKKINTLAEIIEFVELKKYKPGVIYHQIKERPSIKVSETDLKKWQELCGYKKGWWIHQKHLINI